MLAVENEKLREKLSKYEAVSDKDTTAEAISIVEREKALSRAGELVDELGPILSGLGLLRE